jgi:hypothetical protein
LGINIVGNAIKTTNFTKVPLSEGNEHWMVWELSEKILIKLKMKKTIYLTILLF